MAVVVPIISTFDNRGIKNALREINNADGGFRKLEATMKLARVGMYAAAAGAAAFAVKLGVDAVQAAMEEEKELAALNQTLKNLGFAEASGSVNTFIDDLQYTSAVTDSELRPAFDRLVRSTGNVTEAQDLLKLALDASAGSGKSLQAVSEALGRAADGNTTALGKLGLGIDKATLATGTLRDITDRMKTLFAGQASAAANTFEGRMKTLAIAASELQEAFGSGFIEGFGEAVAAGEGLTDQLRELQDEAARAGKVAGKYSAEAVDMGAASLNAADSLSTLATAPSWDSLIAYLRDSTGMMEAFDWVVNAISGSKFTSVAAGMVSDLLGIKIAADAAVDSMNSIGNGGYTPDPNRDYKPAYSYTPDPYNQYEDYTQTLLALQKKINDKARAEAAAAAAARDSARASGSSSAAAKELTAAQKKLAAAYEKSKDAVEEWKDRLEQASDAVKTAKDELNNYADGIRDWVTSGISLSEAFKAAGDSYTAIEEAYLDKVRDGGGKVTDEVRAQAAAAAKAGAISWLDALDQSITNSTALTQKIRDLMGTLNPEDSLGNKLLLEQLMSAKPADAALAADELIKNSLGPAYAAALSKNFGEASSLGIDVASIWYGQGVREAEAQYQGIKTTLEGKLQLLSDIGKKMGQSVADGYNSVVKNLPADVRLPTGGRGKSGQTVNVSVAAGVGNPVEIARTIENVLKSRNVRLGAG